jgi:hypothetical protein
MKWAAASVLDGGTDLIRTLAGTASRVKMLLVKNYALGDSYATVSGNACASQDMVAGDFTQSGGAGAARTTTVTAKNSVSVTAATTQYDQGTATSGGATTLTDTGKAFGTNAHATRSLNILTGTGAGQSRRIVSNTATVLTVDTAWGTNPDATSTYAIRDDQHIAIVDSTGSAVLLVTDETTNQVLASGNTFNFPSWTYVVGQPT